MDRHIYRHALGAAAGVEVGAVDVRQIAAAAQQRLYILVGAGAVFDFLQVVVYAGIFGEISIYKLAALLAAEARLLRYAVRRQAVDYAEVKHFGNAAHFRINFVQRRLKHQRRRGCVNVLAAAKGFQQSGITGQMRQHPQLNLGVIGGK